MVKHVQIFGTSGGGLRMKTGALIGRFQPLHKGHLEAIKFALKHVDRLVIVVGSAQKNHEKRNPFTAGERVEMLWRTLKSEGLLDRVVIIPVPDVENHDIWVYTVRTLTPKFEVVFSNDPLTLMLFERAGVKTIEVPLTNRSVYMATEVRRRMVEGENWEELVPPEVAEFIREIDGVERVRRIYSM